MRLGNLARMIADNTGQTVQSIEFVLYNSFAKTGKGHGTDKGLIAGFMGCGVGNPDIRKADALAKERRLNYTVTNYYNTNNYPPNTAKFVIKLQNNEILTVVGHSIGGGKVYISQINKDNLVLRGEQPTLVLFYKDQPGMIWQVTKILADNHINIADLICKRRQRDIDAVMTITMDTMPSSEDIAHIREIPDIYTVWALDKIE